MISLMITVGLFVSGFYFGQRNEKSHFLSIQQREKIMAGMPYRSTGKKEVFAGAKESQIFHSSVVLGQDYFKAIIFAVVNIFGGRVGVYESLLDRGRREALLRVKSQAKLWGATELVNVRYQTANINQNSGGRNQGGAGVMEVLVYATGLKFNKDLDA